MQTIDCSGAPRDLGVDQGRACARAIADSLAARGLRPHRRRLPGLRRLTGGPVLGAGVGREVVRHQPHVVERMSGIATAARVALDALMEDVVASAYATAGHPLAQPALGCATAAASGGIEVARELDAAWPWLVRRSAPEVGFASVELTLPWLAGSVAGVNAAGLAAAAAVPRTPPRHAGLLAAPAWLLVQECLQRFDDLDGAVEWCAKRPSSGAFHLLLADATGDVALVETSGMERSIAQRGGDAVAAGGDEAAREDLRKRLTEGARAPGLACAAVAACSTASLIVSIDGRDTTVSAR